MNNQIVKIIVIFLLIASCNGLKPMKDQDPLFGEKKIDKKQQEVLDKKKIKLFIAEDIINKEFNPTLKINLENIYDNSKEKINLYNNIGRYDYEGILAENSKFKFSKIVNFNQNEPKLIFIENDLIFFDKKGTLTRYDEFNKKVWVLNNYSKIEKKSKPFLYLANNQDILIVADSISKFYAIDINNGNLIWTKNNSSSFNSEIKIHQNKFFITDSQNILHCFSIKDGKKLWSHETDNILIKSSKKLSIVIDKEVVYFNNSIGDIRAISHENGSLIWQLTTLNNDVYAESLSLKSSDLVLDNQSIYFSNNRNEFYSIDVNSGTIRWKQKINSSIRPTIIGNTIITITQNGFLIIIDKISGNIVRITDIFEFIKEKKRKEISPVGFIVGSKYIYATISNGRIVIINITSGKYEKIIKIDGNKISKPFVFKNNLFIVKDSAIIQFD